MTRILAFLLLLAGMSLHGEPPRIVSLSPSLTELVCHLGGERFLVGRSTACDFPESVKKLPAAGNFAVPVLSKLIRLRAQVLLVDCFQDPNAASMIERAGVRVMRLPLRSIGDYRAAVAAVGKLLEREEAAARELKRVDAALDELAALPKPKPRTKVLVLVWDKPPMAAGRSSHLSEYVWLCGGENLGDAGEAEFFRCSSDWLAKSGAEVILMPTDMGGGRKLQLRGASELPAWKGGRVYTDLASDEFFRMGPRFDRALKTLYRKLQP